MDEKKIVAIAMAAIAEELGEDVKKLRVVSFKKCGKGSLAKYLEKNQIQFKKYQLGDA